MILFSIILRILCVGFVGYPREIKKGTDVVQILIDLPLLLWTAYLFFG